MSPKNTCKNLTKEQIKILQNQGCSAQDWSLVKVTDGFNPHRVINVQFLGPVQLGKFTENIRFPDGLEKPSGIYNAALANCTIADNVRISNIGVHLANYDIAHGACIENVGTIATRPGASFGNGVEVAVLNEAGGREVVLFDELSAQFAYLMCMHRYRPHLTQKLFEIAHKDAQKARSDRGKVGQYAHISSTPEIIDVNVGPHAVINAAASLINGTILSSADAQSIIDSNVVAQDFIIAEAASVTGAAHLKKVFIGQGCQIGKQFSAENSLFFSNCEAFNGEACSIFAGPFTVTHHKSTLLIACLFSFYNAGSGTNQSNHMYKLGPVHEGKLERGAKAASFSYMMWPCRIGPFSIILGKHTRIFDTSDFPFTHLEADPDGKCLMVPGLYLATAGTVRDAQKWPSRDRRKGPKKRDIISYPILSPYTVGKMLKASSILKNLIDTTDKSVDEVPINGAHIKRILLRTCQKYYRTGIEMYLLEKVFTKAEMALNAGIKEIPKSFAAKPPVVSEACPELNRRVEPNAVYSPDWVDIGGQLMPRQRLLDLTAAIESGQIADVAAFHTKMETIHQAAEIDEWLWVKNTCKEFLGRSLDTLTKNDLVQLAESYRKTKIKFLRQILADAEKDFSALSRTGFGQDGSPQDIDEDFQQVRGRFDDNKFVKETLNDIQSVERRVTEFKEKIAAAPWQNRP